jgi:hypothetical protein
VSKPPHAYTLKEAAERTGDDVRTLQRHVIKGYLRAHPGRDEFNRLTRYVDADELARWAEARAAGHLTHRIDGDDENDGDGDGDENDANSIIDIPLDGASALERTPAALQVVQALSDANARLDAALRDLATMSERAGRAEGERDHWAAQVRDMADTARRQPRVSWWRRLMSGDK